LEMENKTWRKSHVNWSGDAHVDAIDKATKGKAE
jgi:hypothetical protein